MTERLTAVAIQRNGETFSQNFKSHYQLRCWLSDPDPQRSTRGDVDGFLTSTGRFVNRFEAKDIAIQAKQIHDRWRETKRELLSSDINW
jgi:hypothetical protein